MGQLLTGGELKYSLSLTTDLNVSCLLMQNRGRFNPAMNTLPILQEIGWVPGTPGMGADNLTSHQESISDCAGCYYSLYQPKYPGLQIRNWSSYKALKIILGTKTVQLRSKQQDYRVHRLRFMLHFQYLFNNLRYYGLVSSYDNITLTVYAGKVSRKFRIIETIREPTSQHIRLKTLKICILKVEIHKKNSKM